MKHLKMLGLAAVAAMALTAFPGAGTASATGGVLCENTTAPCSSPWVVGSHMNFHLRSGSSVLIESTGGLLLDTCSGSAITGEVTRVGSTTEKAVGTIKLSGFTRSGCTGHTTTVTGGTLEVTGLSGGKGTVFASGFTVTTSGSSQLCYYTAGTTNDLGTFTPGTNDLDGIFVINAIVNKVDNATHNSDLFCVSTVRYTAEYTQTGSTPLAITEG